MARQKFVAGNNLKFSPRAFAQSFFKKLDAQDNMNDEENNTKKVRTRSGRMIFLAGVENLAEVEAVEKYPVVTDITPSATTANVLRGLMYGQDGILTAYLSYLYLSWIAAPYDKTVGDYLSKLADNNGKILNALGNIAVAFGGDPSFSTQNGRNWSTQFLLLNKKLFPRNAIAMEQKAISDLEKAIGAVENKSLQTLLTSIKDDKQQIVKDLANFEGN